MAHARERRTAEEPAPALATEYVCPMHPAVVQFGPGTCPVCGMALEPRAPVAEESSPELDDMERRLLGSALLTVPLVVIAMADMLAGGSIGRGLGSGSRAWLELALATPVVVWGAQPFFVRAVASVRDRSPNMFTLIGIGVGAAYGYSVVATLVPGVFPASFRGHDGEVPLYFE